MLAAAGAVAGAIVAPPALAQSTGRPEWPMYGGGPSNTGCVGSSAEIRQNPSRKWDLNVKTPAKSGFAVFDGTVYAYGDNGNIYAVSEAGDVQVYGIGAAGNGTASSGLPVERTATPAVADGALYVGGLDGRVYAIDVDQQSQVWSTGIGQSIRASPIVTGERAFVASLDGTIAALSVVDGTQEWSASRDLQVLSSPALDEGALYVGAGDARLYGFGTGDGSVEWEFDADGTVHASPTVDTSFRSVEDAWDVPKVADWGLSKHLLDHSKSVEGLSPQYAAPEQFDEDFGSADDITDIYQVGAVFYELFTGRPPFEGKPAKAMHKVLHEQPTPPSEIADVPEELDEVLLTALAKEKTDRYEDILLLRNALQELFDEY